MAGGEDFEVLMTSTIPVLALSLSFLLAVGDVSPQFFTAVACSLLPSLHAVDFNPLAP